MAEAGAVPEEDMLNIPLVAAAYRRSLSVTDPT